MLKAKLGYITILLFLSFSLIYYLNINNEERYMIVLEETKLITEKLFDVDFKYVINNKLLCSDDSLALIMVTSYFGNVETRSAMRRAFSEDDLGQIKIRRIFLLGLAPSDKYTSQKSIEDENKRFGDIIQGNFIEAYRNLTYKHVMGLKWVGEHCRNTQYVIKMDDDIVANIERIPRLLESLLKYRNDNLIAGYILRNMKPIREPANKWFVTAEEFKYKKYPQFVSGWFYITTPKTCIELYNVSRGTTYFWIDDTFVTGILAQKLKIKHLDISTNFTVHSEFLDCCVNDVRLKNIDCDILVGPNGGNNNLFYDFNNAMAICNLKLCKPRILPMNRTCVAEKKFNLGKGNAIVESYRLH